MNTSVLKAIFASMEQGVILSMVKIGSNVNHRLKTRMISVMGYIGMLLKEKEGR